MNHSLLQSVRVAIAISLISPLLCLAQPQGNPASIDKVTNPQGNVIAVTVTFTDVIFKVSAIGNIISIEPNAEQLPKEIQEATGAKYGQEPQALDLKFYPAGSAAGLAGKLASVNDIPINYYSCAMPATLPANVTFPNRIQTIKYTPSTQQNLPCASHISDGGKIQRIGEISFSYYPVAGANNQVRSSINSPDLPAGKINRVGSEVITYSTQ